MYSALRVIKAFKPSIFKSTIYRIPTRDELEEVHSYNLSSDEILSGFSYTIVGRGIMRSQEKEMIIESIKSLCKMYPENKNYTSALQKAGKNF